MNRYDVPVEVRQRGTRDAYVHMHFVVDAATPDNARHAAVRDAQAGGWETRNALTPRRVVRRKVPPPADCTYIRQRGTHYNAGGALPCGTCPGCVAEREGLERMHKWNEATARGAKPNR